MKKKTLLSIGLLALSLAIPSNLFSQQNPAQPQEPATKLEAFLTKKGQLIVKDFYSLGKINGKFGAVIKFDALVVYQPGHEAQRIRGLRIEITEGDRLEISNASFLDMDELESLAKAISYMNDLLAKWQTENKEYTEVIFMTKGDFRIGFYQQGNLLNAFSSSGHIRSATIYLNWVKDLTAVKDIVDKSIKLLSEK